MKRDYDQTAKVRSLEEGEMVLMRLPGLTGKLDDSWDGPYKIYRKVNAVEVRER